MWERVGDRPVNPRGLAFDGAGALWTQTVFGAARLGPDQARWVTLGDPGSEEILLLGPRAAPDTLLVSQLAIYRSVDGGRTWAIVTTAGGASLFETSSGVILAGSRRSNNTGIIRSTDRGATWAPSVFVGGPGIAQMANAFLQIPSGRIVAACDDGVAYSDDDGATWTRSALWRDVRYGVYTLARAADGRLWAGLDDGAAPGGQAYVSADDGVTWAPTRAFYEEEGYGMAVQQILAVPGGPNPSVGVVYVFTTWGRAWRTPDGGQTWEVLPRVVPRPGPDGNRTTLYAVVGLDGRLYVAAYKTGCCQVYEWVYRSSVPVVTAEAAPAEAPGGLGVSVRPNPSRGRTEVVVSLAQAQDVRVVVLDARGREVAVVLSGPVAPGERALSLDTSAWPAGVYVVRVVAGGQTASARLVVAR